MITIRSAGTEDIPAIIAIARATWPLTYGPILTPEQIRYMLDLFYSPAALEAQMQTSGHRFLLLEESNQPLAFASYNQLSPTEWKLQKIYILPSQQGKGRGRLLIRHITDDLRQRQAGSLLLNVNRYNQARSFYEKLGFSVVSEEDLDIGQGFFMNDYVMRLPL